MVVQACDASTCGLRQENPEGQTHLDYLVSFKPISTSCLKSLCRIGGGIENQREERRGREYDKVKWKF